MNAALLRYQAAQRRAKLAAELCPHWDYEQHPREADCCHELADAIKERKLAREAWTKTVLAP